MEYYIVANMPESLINTKKEIALLKKFGKAKLDEINLQRAIETQMVDVGSEEERFTFSPGTITTSISPFSPSRSEASTSSISPRPDPIKPNGKPKVGR